eukprot:TRINITY_DN45821_c0_g1_i2.p2 TRINITY_DN45821_c0_g1~~TRINITY_DN45821_c0_g1_i2.p2  ORF type:complete len:741 (-),score=122.05 TRINITY_DN45821_c0_g1_i2:204-2426(-)
MAFLISLTNTFNKRLNLLTSCDAPGKRRLSLLLNVFVREMRNAMLVVTMMTIFFFKSSCSQHVSPTFSVHPAVGNISLSTRTTAIAFNPSGSKLATGTDAGDVLLWDVSKPNSARLLATLSLLHNYQIQDLSFSADGSLFAAASFYKLILWDSRNPTSPSIIANLSGWPSGHVAISPDGKMMACGSLQHNVVLWDLSNRGDPVIGAIVGQSDASAVAFSPDSKTLCISAAGGVELWDVGQNSRNPSLLFTISTITSAQTLQFSPDGRTLCINSMMLWDVRDRQNPTLIATLQSDNDIAAAAFSQDSNTLATSATDEQNITVILWDVENPSEPTKLTSYSEWFRWLPYTPFVLFMQSDRILGVSCYQTYNMYQLQYPEGQPLIATLMGHSDVVTSLATSADSKYIASGSLDDSVRLWNIQNPDIPSLASVLFEDCSVNSAAWSPDGKTLAVGLSNGVVHLWEVTYPQHPLSIGKLSGHSSFVNSLAFSSDGKILASGSSDQSVKLWSVVDQDNLFLIQTIADLHAAVLGLAFSGDGQALALGLNDSSLELWNLKNYRAPFLIGSTFDSAVISITFSPNSKLIATGSSDCIVQLWNMESSLDILGTLSQDSFSLLCEETSLAFSLDGLSLATGAEDSVVRVWDVQDKTVRANFTGHLGPIQAVAFFANGSALASASSDHTVKLWAVPLALAVASSGDWSQPTTLILALGVSGGVVLLVCVVGYWCYRRRRSGYRSIPPEYSE